MKRTLNVAWCGAALRTHVGLSPIPPPPRSFSSLQIKEILEHRLCLSVFRPITKFLWVSVYLSGPSGFLINYDMKGFDVPGIKRREGAQTISRNINYLMDIIRRKLGLTVKYKFKVGSAMVILTLNPILSHPLSRRGWETLRRKEKVLVWALSWTCCVTSVGHCLCLGFSFIIC